MIPYILYHSFINFQSSVLLSVEQLCDSIELDQLPLIFHGLFVYCHEDWVRFHMVCQMIYHNLSCV